MRLIPKYVTVEPNTTFETVEIRHLELGDEHLHTIDLMKQLIGLYEAWYKPEKAKEWRAKLHCSGVT